MKKIIFIFFIFFTTTLLSQTLHIKGFGEVSILKKSHKRYEINLGKYGLFSAKGTLIPLSLEVTTTLEKLKEFPGYKLYKKLDLKEVTITFMKTGVKIKATLDTQKNFGDFFRVLQIPNPEVGIEIEVSKTKFKLAGELDFEEDPIVIEIIPKFSRFTLENLGLEAEASAGEEMELSLGFSIQTRWKPSQWDPDIQSVTAFSYNLTTNEISASISMTDTWKNPFLLKKLLKQEDAIVFSDVAAVIDWPVGAPAPSGFGFTIGKAKFFDLEFSAFLSMTPSDKKIALQAQRNQISMNDFSNILRKGFGLKVPKLFPDNIYIKDVVILFSPNGGTVGEFEVQQGFILKGKAQFLDALSAEVNFYANFDDGFYLYYNMDAAFTTYFQNLFKNHPRLKYISGKLLRSFSIKKVQLEAKADMKLNMSAKTYCEFSLLGKNVKFSFKGAFSPEKIKKKMLQEIINIALPQANAILNRVTDKVNDAEKKAYIAAKVTSNLLKKYAALAVVKKDHIHALRYNKSDHHCYTHCVPRRANEMTRELLFRSKKTIQRFYNQVINDLIKIEGVNPQMTKKMREKYVLKEWNRINMRINQDWEKVKWNKGYIGFFYTPKNATNGGHYYRRLVDAKKREYLQLKNHLYQEMLSTKQKSSYLKFVRIQNRWKSTFINLEKGLKSSQIASGWHSAMWQFEPVVGTTYIRIKNRWKGTYLHIQRGKLEASKVQPGWHSAQWKLEKAEGHYFRIKNRWKGTYLNIEHGRLTSSAIKQGWHSAMWQLNDFYSK